MAAKKAPPSLISQAPVPEAPASSSPAAVAPAAATPAASSDVAGELPTIEQMVKEGFSEADAYGDLVEEMARVSGKPEEECASLSEAVKAAFRAKAVSGMKGKAVEPYYRCQALTPRGEFWAIGRKFTSNPQDPANRIPMSSLDEKQRARLEKANPKFLAVIPVHFE